MSTVQRLEGGEIIFLGQPFTLTPGEQSFLRPDCVGSSKSVKFSFMQQRMWGEAEKDEASPVLFTMLKRYAEFAKNIIHEQLPGYTQSLIIGNTSYRPVEAAGRIQSKRHDDRLLHVDSFPSRPMRGNRILRVFTNINPNGQPRLWRTGDAFPGVAKHFLPRIGRPFPGSAAMLKMFGITKQKRSLYDHYMLHIHDAMKLDDQYQATVKKNDIAIPAATSWIVYSDQVSHAALAGQYMMEQTFLLPVAGMNDPATSPLRVLESLTGKPLV